MIITNMKKPSLSFELEGYLRNKGNYIHISELEDFGRSLGFLSSNVDRRLRELRKAGKIESELRNFEGTKTTWWRFHLTIMDINFNSGMMQQSFLQNR